MPKFRVNWHLALNGKFYEPNAEVDLTEAEAAAVNSAVITRLDTPTPPEPEATADTPTEVPVDAEPPADGPTDDDPPVTPRAGRKHHKGGG